MTWSTENVSSHSNQKGKTSALKKKKGTPLGLKPGHLLSTRHRLSVRRHSKGPVYKCPPAEEPISTSNTNTTNWSIDSWYAEDQDDVCPTTSTFTRDTWKRRPIKSKDIFPILNKNVGPETCEPEVYSLPLQLSLPSSSSSLGGSYNSDVCIDHTDSFGGSEKDCSGILDGVNCYQNAPKCGKEGDESRHVINVGSNTSSVRSHTANTGKEWANESIERKYVTDEETTSKLSQSQSSGFCEESSEPICSVPHRSTSRPELVSPRDLTTGGGHMRITCTAEVHPDQPQCLHTAPALDSVPLSMARTGSGEHRKHVVGGRDESVNKSHELDDIHGCSADSISMADIGLDITSLTGTLQTLSQHSELSTASESDIDYNRESISTASSVAISTDTSAATNSTVNSCSRNHHSRASKKHTSRRKHQIKVRLARRPRKILIFGDMMSGKTNLGSTYSSDRYQDQYVPTLVRCVNTDAVVQGETINLVLVDISGRDDFEPLRRLACRKVDAIILCYPVNSINSMERIRSFWVPECKRHAPKAPYVVVGTKRDIRDAARDRLEDLKQTLCGSENEATGRIHLEAEFIKEFVTQDRGKRMAQEVGARGFYECSSMYRDGTRNLFESVTMMALQKSRRKRKSTGKNVDMCTIL